MARAASITALIAFFAVSLIPLTRAFSAVNTAFAAFFARSIAELTACLAQPSTPPPESWPFFFSCSAWSLALACSVATLACSSVTCASTV